jgi:predicted TIM-barrel fold metal-dependent hydrolase
MALPALAPAAVRRPAGTIIDTHIHLFAPNSGFPYHKNGTYNAPAFTLEQYLPFVKEARLDHTIVVHPEPYQDDHRYLEYCFAHEPAPGYFKGTCLFDPVDPATPGRMRELAARHPGRIVALRIHEMAKPGAPPTRGGAITGRDMRDPAMKITWGAARDLGLAIQMHFLPYYAPQIGELAGQFTDLPVILDHLGRAGQGPPEPFEGILKLGKLPRAYMKFSGLGYSSKQGYPFRDAQPTVRRLYDAFGPDRMIWGGVGHDRKQFEQAVEVFESMFAFTSEAERAKIRGTNAARLFGF